MRSHQHFGVEGRRAEDVIHELRSLNKTDLDGVVAVALSHSKVACAVKGAPPCRTRSRLSTDAPRVIRVSTLCFFAASAQLANRNALVLVLLDSINSDHIATGANGFYAQQLQHMAELQGSKFAKVRARAVLGPARDHGWRVHGCQYSVWSSRVSDDRVCVAGGSARARHPGRVLAPFVRRPSAGNGAGAGVVR